MDVSFTPTVSNSPALFPTLRSTWSIWILLSERVRDASFFAVAEIVLASVRARPTPIPRSLPAPGCRNGSVLSASNLIGF